MPAQKLISEIRIPALDGVRGTAALMVVLWHLTGSMVTGEGWTGIVTSVTIFGRSGVDLFFVLSGFLIIGILVDRRESTNLFHTFYIRRVCRIIPPYLTLILLYWICYIALGESAAFNTDHGLFVQVIGQFTFTWNFLMAIADGGIARGFSVTWSVAIEEHFYLIFPFLLWKTPREHIWKLLVVIGISSALGRAICHLWFPNLWLAPYVLTPFRLDGLCAGGLLALGYRNDAFRSYMTERRIFLWRTAMVILASVPFVVALTRPNILTHMYLWGHSYLTFTYTITIMAIIFNSGKFRMLNTAPLKAAGKISYSLYLFHPLFLSLYFLIAGKPESITSWEDVFLTFASLITTILFCVLLYSYVERPAQRFGHRFKYDSPPAAL